MTHDPLCRWGGDTPNVWCEDCELISKVRRDQVQQCINAVTPFASWRAGRTYLTKSVDLNQLILALGASLRPAARRFPARGTTL